MSRPQKLYGLIGFPLGHSFSAGYYNEKFEREGISDTVFRNFQLESIEQVEAMLRENPALAGFNITIPYKERIIPYLDDISPEAREIGAVNCIKISGGKLKGFNTDQYGFRSSLLELIGDKRPPALILGTGGASKAVKYVLAKLGIRYKVVSRAASPGYLTYGELTPQIMRAHKLLINCTPLGTFPKVDGCPDIPYDDLDADCFLFDLVYNPPLTEFLRRGKQAGANMMNGYDMLIGQAEEAWRIWQDPRL